jgi:hypothetical protein
MPLRPLLFLLVECESKEPEFSGGGNTGGDDDSGGEADADTDSDSDTDSVDDFDYDQLTDVIAYDSPTTVLATKRDVQVARRDRHGEPDDDEADRARRHAAARPWRLRRRMSPTSCTLLRTKTAAQ